MGKEDFITIKADSMEEALEKARLELDTSQENIELKVMAKEKHGFLFQKEAVIIQVRKKEPDWDQLVEEMLSEKAESLESVDISEDGSVAIRDGKVIVKNPLRGGKYPTIEPSRHTRVSINGETVCEPTIITAEDDIKIEICNQEPLIDLEVEITEDKLNAFLVINRRFGKEYRVKDTSPCLHVRVITETAKAVPPPKISPREVVQLLKDKGIVYGINEAAISRVVESGQEGGQKVLVAVGRPPERSKSATVEYVFQKKMVSSGSPLNPYKDAVDQSVEIGEVLAIKKEPQEGKAGTNLFGESIIPTPPEDTQILIGDGVKLIKNETVAVATIAGRPVLEGRQNKILKVLPVYTVPGDVDINVGNISFKGDIIIYGNVLEGFQVVAGGNIEVHGNVIQADLNAAGNITVYKNVISSELNAGGMTLIYKRLLPELQRIFSLLQNLLQAMQILKAKSSFKVNDLQQGEGRLVQLLIDTKFKALPKTIEGLFEFIKTSKTTQPPEIKEVVDQLQKLTGLNPLRIQKGQELFDILRILKAAGKQMQETCEFMQPSNMSAGYIQNSVVKSSGDIVIAGRGSITSEMIAGGDILVKGQNAVVRGGKLHAGGATRVNELGSNANVTCTVRINEGAVLEAQLVHPAVTIESIYGNHKFKELSRNVKAYISSEGFLKVEKLKAK